jgi:hypothetical protein
MENFYDAWNNEVCGLEHGNCLAAAIDTISRKRIPMWLYEYSEVMFKLFENSLLNTSDVGEVWKALIEVGGLRVEKVKAFRVEKVGQLERLLKNCWETESLVILEATQANHVVGLVSQDGFKWQMTGVVPKDLDDVDMSPKEVFRYLIKNNGEHENVYVIEIGPYEVKSKGMRVNYL